MTSETDKARRRSRRQRNLTQRDSWNRTKGGTMKDCTKYNRKGQPPLQTDSP